MRVTEKISKCSPRHLRERECSPPMATAVRHCLRSSCRRVSGWEDPTHGVKNHETKHNGDVGDIGGVLSDLLLGLIIIVSVEVSEVCVGVGLSSELGVEVLVSFLQDQVVFVESLLGRCVERGTGVSTNEMIIDPEWQSKKSETIQLKQGRKEKRRHRSMGGRWAHEAYILQSKVKAFANRPNGWGGEGGRNDKPPQG